MDVDALKEFCSALPDASSKLSGPPGNVLVYYARGRKFAYFKTSEPERWRFSIRTSPERFLELTDMPGIKPARFLARHYWVTIVDVASLPSAHLVELVHASHAAAIRPRGRGTGGRR